MEKEIGKLIFYRYKGNNKFQSCGEIESNRRFEFGGDNMLIKIGDFEFTEVWDGVSIRNFLIIHR